MPETRSLDRTAQVNEAYLKITHMEAIELAWLRRIAGRKKSSG